MHKLLQHTLFIGVMLFAVSCSEKRETPQAEKIEKVIPPKPEPEEMGFMLEGQKFLLNESHTSVEKTLRDETGRTVMRLYLVQNDYKQSLDMLFPVPKAESLPVTFEFVDKYKVKDTGSEIDYAVCLFSSYYKEGWHEIPKTKSTITVTSWDVSKRTMSGTFELHIQNEKDKNDVIDITDGYFKNVIFEIQPPDQVISVGVR